MRKHRIMAPDSCQHSSPDMHPLCLLPSLDVPKPAAVEGAVKEPEEVDGALFRKASRVPLQDARPLPEAPAPPGLIPGLERFPGEGMETHSSILAYVN